ncbi:MAG: hypothetical protein H7831_14500 [Magnetococcus sp. WYHC-3]
MMESEAAVFMSSVYMAYLLISVVVAVLIGRDAGSRGMSPMGWGALVLFLPLMLGVLVYIAVRKPRLATTSGSAGVPPAG